MVQSARFVGDDLEKPEGWNLGGMWVWVSGLGRLVGVKGAKKKVSFSIFFFRHWGKWPRDRKLE